MRKIALALTSVAAIIVPAASAHAQNPLSSIFQCNNANNSQRGGAVVGGLLGGLLGNQVAGDDDRTLGTILGAAVGAAAGSYVGCNMSGSDTTRAETATLQALNQNRPATWTNAQTGASGRIDIVNSYYQNNVSTRVPDYANPQTLEQITFARGVQFPVNYQINPAVYRAGSRVNLRAAPDSRGTVIGRIEARETFDVLAQTSNGWLLVARNGQAVGYVSASVVQFDSYGNEYFENPGRTAGNYSNQPQQVTERQMCRTFDQTVQNRSGANRQTERFTACQNSAGEWVING